MLVRLSFWPEQVSPFHLVAFTLCRSNCSALALVEMVQGTVKAKKRHSASSRSSRQVSCHWSGTSKFSPLILILGGRGGVTHTLAALDLWRGCFSRRTLARSLVRCLAWSILKLKKTKQKRINNYSMRWEWIGGLWPVSRDTNNKAAMYNRPL